MSTWEYSITSAAKPRGGQTNFFQDSMRVIFMLWNMQMICNLCKWEISYDGLRGVPSRSENIQQWREKNSSTVNPNKMSLISSTRKIHIRDVKEPTLSGKTISFPQKPNTLEWEDSNLHTHRRENLKSYIGVSLDKVMNRAYREFCTFEETWGLNWWCYIEYTVW
jgi:hypothetical protein